MAADLGQAYVQIVPSAEGIAGSITKVLEPESVSAGKSSGNTLGQTITKTVAALGVGKTIADSISNGMSFESGMAKVSTLFTGTSAEFDQLQQSIMNVSSSTGVAASQLAEAAYSAESASVPMGNLGTMIEASSKLATAGFTDIDTALSATAKTMNAYGMMSDDVSKTQENMEKVQRILIQTQNKGITTVGELGASLAQVTPTAAAFGVEFDQVGAALAGMTAQGTPTAQATTQLNSMIAELGKEGTMASDKFRELTGYVKEGGLSFSEAMAAGWDLSDVLSLFDEEAQSTGSSMVDMFSSIEAGKAAMSIWNSDWAGNMEAMATEADVVGDSFSTMADTASFKLQKMKNALTNIGIKAFNGVADGFIGALEGIQTIIEVVALAFSNLGGAVAGFVTNFAGYIGQMLGISGQFSIVQVVADGLAGAINTLASVFTFLTEHMDIVAPVLSGLTAAFVAFKVGSGIMTIMSTITGITTALSAAGGLIPALGALLGPIGLVAAAIGIAVAAGVAIYKIWDAIKEKAGVLKDAVTEKWNALKTNVSATVESLKASVSEKWTALQTNVSNTVESLKSGISTKFDAVKQKATDIFNAVKDAITNPVETARDLVGKAIDSIKGLFSGAHFEFPHIKLPHFSWTWQDIGGLVSIPKISIEWYKKAYETPYVFDRPTVMPDGRGYGDGRGGEMVYGHANLMQDIKEAVQSAGQRVFSPVINIYTQEGQSNEEIAQYVMDRIKREYERAGKVYA